MIKGTNLIAVVLTFSFLAISNPANSQTVLEHFIAKENPCKGVKTKLWGVSIGVDYLKKVNITQFDVKVKGDTMFLALVGSLSCRTSEKATFEGDVGALFNLSSEMNLANCSVIRKSVSMSGAHGRFSKVAALLQNKIESTLTDEMVKFLSKNCKAIKK